MTADGLKQQEMADALALSLEHLRHETYRMRHGGYAENLRRARAVRDTRRLVERRVQESHARALHRRGRCEMCGGQTSTKAAERCMSCWHAEVGYRRRLILVLAAHGVSRESMAAVVGISRHHLNTEIYKLRRAGHEELQAYAR